MISRRAFLGGCAAGGALAGCRTVFPWTERPLLTIGVASDPHIDVRYPSRTRLLAQAFGRMRDMGAEVVVVAGDLTERGLVSDLRIFADTWKTAFPDGCGADGEKVELFAVCGNRDMMCSGKISSAFKATNRDAAIYPSPAAAWRTCFGEPYSDDFLCRRIHGYTFLGAHWGFEKTSVKAFVDSQIGRDGGDKPFFFVQHPHPDGTCFTAWRSEPHGTTFEALKDHANAVAISGHSHCTLVDDHCVWRGPFVSVAGGSTWDALPVPDGPEPRLGTKSQFAMMRIYGDRIVYERYDVLTGKRLGDDIVWSEPDPSADASFRFATWNIGHFSWGRSSEPTVTSAEAARQGGEYRRFLRTMDADVLGVCEFSDNFTCDGTERADEFVFSAYPRSAKGPKRAYQHDAVFYRRFRVLDRRQKFYPRHLQDTYYQAVKLDVFGRGVWFVETHLDWKVWERGHEGDRIDQMRTLIADFASEPFVVIGGDFNVTAMGPDGKRRFTVEQYGLFANAGYRMANDGTVATAKRGAPLDNIFVRGLKMREVAFHKAGDLSDHDAVSCTLSFVR